MLSPGIFTNGIGKLAELTNTNLTELKLEIYYDALKDYLTDQEFMCGVKKLCEDLRYDKMPLPAAIREACKGNIDDWAVMAYENFTDGRSKTGIYKTVIFEDKKIHDVVMAMGGWEAVCMISEDEWRFRRKEFIEYYRAFTRHPRQDTLPKLAGIIERTNSAMGFAIPEPMYITSSGLSQIPLLREPDSEAKAIGLQDDVW